MLPAPWLPWGTSYKHLCGKHFKHNEHVHSGRPATGSAFCVFAIVYANVTCGHVSLSLSWLRGSSQVHKNSDWPYSFCTSNGDVHACGVASEQKAPTRNVLSLARPATGSALASDAPQLRSTGDRLGKGERCH